MELEDTAETTAGWIPEQARHTAQMAGQAATQGYDSAKQFITEKGLNLDLREFVRREPWVALAAVFAIGYFAAKIVHRISRAAA
jgi:hypothetical protein